MEISNKYFKIGYPGWSVGKALKKLNDNINDSKLSPEESIRSAIKEGGISVLGHPKYPMEYHTKDFLKSINFNNSKNSL